MNKKGIFVPTLVVLSILLFTYLNFQLNPLFSSDYRFKFIYILNGEVEVKKEMFDGEQVVKYNAYEALEILFNDGICEDWSVCNPVEMYREEFIDVFDKLYEGDYQVNFNFNNGVKIDAFKDVMYEKENLKIETKHVFSHNIKFDWNIVRQLYEECKDVKSCEEKGECKAECREDTNYLNFEYFIPLEFVKKLSFKVSKRGELF